MARLFYFLRRAGLHLRRSPFVASVTVGTVAVVFLVLGVVGLVGHNLQRLSTALEAGLQLSVFLEDGLDSEARAVIEQVLVGSPLVERVEYVDPAAALERFRHRLGPQAVVLDEIGDNPLPASLEVTLAEAGRNARAVRELAQQLVGLPGVEEVQYGQAWLDRFFAFLGVARLVGVVIGALIVFAALLIVSNTIRLSVYARQEEIVILKLVGATDGFVKAPFYLEGLWLGTLGATAGMGLTWALFALLAPNLPGLEEPGLISAAVEFLPLEGLLLMIGGGALLGLLGTWVSLGRHLRI